MNDVVMIIALTEAKAKIDRTKPVKDQLIAAMNATKDHWMATDEDTQFRAAIGAVMVGIEGDDLERIKTELRMLKTLGAMISGVPVDLAAAAPPDDFKAIGLQGLWDDVKNGAGAN